MSIVLYKNKNECSGCWACKNICPKSAIDMVSDNEGFKFPQIDKDKCVECGLCLKVCPLKVSKRLVEKENSKKHIGIINLQFTTNYGAVIAAAVLENVVANIVGSEYIVETINYNPSKKMANALMQNMDSAKMCGGWKLYIKSIINSKMNRSSESEKLKRFAVFKNTFLNLTPPVRDAYEIIGEKNYAAFITGSDIVWGPKRSDNFRADGYYLKFAKEKGIKTIAYAPSLDNKIDRKLKKLSDCYRENLKNVDYISVREKDNIPFVQSLTDKKVYACCDPAFLVDSSYYDDMISIAEIDNSNDKYIYVYILEINQDIVDYANQLAKEKNLKICYFSSNHSDYIENSQNCITDGPAEFLYRLKNAEYVLTNSFHCVVFSLLFKKKFLSFTRSGVSIKTSNLLEQFNLTDRIITSENKLDIDDEIDFEKTDAIIHEMKSESMDYLRNSLAD